jgi:diazepam-binding inhibitor (GABA receptor modulator, acyl-CoA-binding protein)
MVHWLCYFCVANRSRSLGLARPGQTHSLESGTTFVSSVCVGDWSRCDAMSQFEAALAYVQSGEGPELSQDSLLQFYALFKQATDGPCTGEAPSRLNVVAYEKWKAHKALGQMSEDEARETYCAELSQVAPGWSSEQSEVGPQSRPSNPLAGLAAPPPPRTLTRSMSPM